MQVSGLVSPFCLLLALTMLVTAFAIVASDAPTENVQIHAARASGNEAVEDALTTHLAGQIRFRYCLLAALFGGSILLTLVSLLTMRGKS